MTLAERIAELMEKHGSLRAAARVLCVEPGYLSRLAAGEKVNPGKIILSRMGLRRVVSYEPIQLRRHDAITDSSGRSHDAEGTFASSERNEGEA